jgi:hypothetical protein
LTQLERSQPHCSLNHGFFKAMPQMKSSSLSHWLKVPRDDENSTEDFTRASAPKSLPK